MGYNCLKVQMSVSMQLRHDATRGIRVLSFSKKQKTYKHFLTTNAGLALALRCYTHCVITLKGHVCSG